MAGISVPLMAMGVLPVSYWVPARLVAPVVSTSRIDLSIGVVLELAFAATPRPSPSRESTRN
jgi:hypothetical protein